MPENDSTAPRAVRLIFEYDGDDIRLVHQSPVDVAVTGFDTRRELRAGRFVEVRDSEGNGLVRVPVRIDTASAEVFPETPGEPITRVDVERPKGAFTVVVPAPPASRSVAVLDVRAPAPPPPGEAAPPRAAGKGEETVLGVFDLQFGGQP
ncbi:hypothetical protein [Sinomonas mesophila]|uniref:hypothetical protein n=1 Tax=Sinomonas mesophila TaxID=1531955 RepID=UPI000987C835|nr:hypothetical protein [Sinomonas mesophila]